MLYSLGLRRVEQPLLCKFARGLEHGEAGARPGHRPVDQVVINERREYVLGAFANRFDRPEGARSGEDGHALEELRFGVVQIVVHNSRVTQIERTEKTRLQSVKDEVET